jgi:hypothetical protein
MEFFYTCNSTIILRLKRGDVTKYLPVPIITTQSKFVKMTISFNDKSEVHAEPVMSLHTKEEQDLFGLSGQGPRVENNQKILLDRYDSSMIKKFSEFSSVK